MNLREEAFQGFTVYESPLDYPGEFVARRWTVGCGAVIQGELFARGSSLEAIRAALPSGLYNLGRQPADEPHIVEVWI